MNEISVIVPVKNGEKKIQKCLEGIFNQTLTPYEVILIDGHSDDKTIDISKKYPVKIFFEEYGTVGGARQEGVIRSTGDFIAFTDADCIPQKDWLENLILEFKNDIVGVGGGIKNIGVGVWEESIAIALDTFLGSANSVQDRVIKNKKFVRSISGCNSMYKKSDIFKAGGYNVKYSMNEDTDLNRKLLIFGKILYTPKAIVFHDQDRNILQFTKRMYSFGKGRGKIRLIDIQIIPPIVCALILIIAVFFHSIILIMIAFYFLVILIFDIKIFLKTKKVLYLFSIPVVFVLEHIAYTIGFWTGVGSSIVRGE